MDVHATSVVRRFAVIEPVVISEPTAEVGNGDQIAAARVVESGEEFLLFAEDVLHTGRVLQQFADFVSNGGIVDVDVRELVIGDGDCLTAAGVNGFASKFVFDADPALLAEEAVEMHRAVHIGDAVFGEENDFDAAFFVEADETADDIINLFQCGRDFIEIQPVALEVVIKMRQIDERQAGPAFLFNPFRALGNPGGALDVGTRSPESLEGKIAEIFFDALTQAHRLGVDIEDLASIRRIERSRRDAEIGGGVHVIPPE